MTSRSSEISEALPLGLPPPALCRILPGFLGGTSIFASGCEFGSGQGASSREVPPADPAGVSHNIMTTHLDRGE